MQYSLRYVVVHSVRTKGVMMSERVRSRRAVLSAGIGAVAATVAGALGRPLKVSGATQAVALGESNIESTLTKITNTSSGGQAFEGSSASGFAVVGTSTSSRGVHGTSSSDIGVNGDSQTGVGVNGFSSSGTGVVASGGNGGFALWTIGRVKIGTSGVATIPSGSTSTTVTPGRDVTAGSFVLLTPRADIGSRALWYEVTATDIANDTFRIRIGSSRTRPTKVAWLLLYKP